MIRFNDALAKVPAQQSSMEATILRCTCATEQEKAKHFDQVCPNAIAIPLGTIAYYHKNPVMRFLYKVRRFLNPSLTFWRP